MGSVQVITLLFYVWCKFRELGGREEFRVLLCNPSGGNLVFMAKIRSTARLLVTGFLLYLPSG